MSGYRVPSPEEAMLISQRRSKTNTPKAEGLAEAAAREAEGLGQIFVVLAPTFQSLSQIATDFIADKVAQRVHVPDSPQRPGGSRAVWRYCL